MPLALAESAVPVVVILFSFAALFRTFFDCTLFIEAETLAVSTAAETSRFGGRKTALIYKHLPPRHQ
ncbi:MAG: hypothetical protein DMG32_10540 [Acidobacteria bacterium]|nr:MAG: hypothetical protein DMG32_10540 [Acidobacteriota bacterium]